MVVEKKKYIIELPENTHWIQWIMESTKDHHPYMEFKQLENLTPHIEPDLDAVRKEAYDKGYQDATVKIGSDEQKIAEKAYQRGLNDAWDAARKIVLSREDGGLFGYEERKAVFGCGNYMALKTFLAPEAIEKIRQYEQEQKQLHVGDEVNAPFGKAIVVNIDSVAEKIRLVYADGHGGFEYFKDAPTKTGRHFPEIAEVLRKMQEKES